MKKSWVPYISPAWRCLRCFTRLLNKHVLGVEHILLETSCASYAPSEWRHHGHFTHFHNGDILDVFHILMETAWMPPQNVSGHVLAVLHICSAELVSWCFEPSQPQRITSGLSGDVLGVLDISGEGGGRRKERRHRDR